MFETINPATGKVLSTYQYHSQESAEALILSLQSVYLKYSHQNLAVRQVILKQIAEKMTLMSDQIAMQIHLEMGKPKAEALAEIKKSIQAIEYFANLKKKLLEPEVLDGPYGKTLLVKKPMGIILSIMPWNFPVWQVVRQAVSQLYLGNVVLLKHSEITAGTAKLIEEAFTINNESVLKNIFLSHEQVALVLSHPFIKGVAFTGSTKAGREVAATAGRNLKKVILELGGSDPYIVLKDCDLNKAAEICFLSRIANSGQVCISSKRWLVDEQILPEFINKVCELAQGIKVAPLAHSKFLNQTKTQVDAFLQSGAKLIYQSAQDDFGVYPFSVLQCDRSHPMLFSEEIFAPVGVIVSFKSEDEAIEIANNSAYGLGAGLFSKDVLRAQVLAGRIEAGTVAINSFVKTHPAIPFGGCKNSGFGVELGYQGIFEFCHFQVVGES